MSDWKEKIERGCKIALKAGNTIMEIYLGGIEVKFKGDKSPLTAADRCSHDIIWNGLSKLNPSIPILI